MLGLKGMHTKKPFTAEPINDIDSLTLLVSQFIQSFSLFQEFLVNLVAEDYPLASLVHVIWIKRLNQAQRHDIVALRDVVSRIEFYFPLSTVQVFD